MKKKFIVALATSLVLSNVASVAFADTGSGSTNSEQSAKNDDNRKFAKLTDAQKLAFEAARDAYKDKHEAILDAFHTAMESAKNGFEKARELATTDEARKAAEVAFKLAVSTATQVKTDALKAVGESPARPTLTAEQIAAIAKYRQDLIAFGIARNAYQIKRDAIRETYRTAVNLARQAYQVARTTLGDSPEKPEKPDFGN